MAANKYAANFFDKLHTYLMLLRIKHFSHSCVPPGIGEVWLFLTEKPRRDRFSVYTYARNAIAALLVLLYLFHAAAAMPQASQPVVAKPNVVATPAPPAAAKVPIDYSGESYIIQKYATDVTYAADGTGERLITVQLKIQSEAAVRQFGVLEFPYESRNEHLDFVYVRVRKPDGSVLPTPDTDAQDQPAEVTRQAPFYSDIRDKQLPVKSLSAGDQLEYQVRQTRTVPAAPNHFWYTQNFIKDAVVLEETASLNVPRQKYVQVESPDLKPAISEEGDRKIYRWKTSQLEKSKPADDKPKKQPIIESPPSIAVTTFKDWAEVGRWYGDLQKDRVAVTPAVQAKANELTKSLSGEEDKIAAIYTYVSTQYRYIGVAFGIGRYQPHSADDVMQNQYGDCKDKHTLLAALLKAEGYDAWPVLLGSQHVLQPAVPSPGQFDHVMTAVTLNKSVLWMDSTSEVAPFRLLFYGLRDKQVLAIPTGSTPVLMKTPANPPFDPLDKYDAKATLTSDGTLTGSFDLSLRGDNELIYRIGFHQTPRVQWNTLIQNVSYASGFAGTTSNVTAGSPEKLDVPFQISYDYTRKKFSDWDNHRILPLMPPIAFNYGEDDEKPADTIMLGGPANFQFRTVIALPHEYRAELPAAVSLHTSFADYGTTYSQTDGNLVIERKVHIGPREIPVAQWDDYLRFEKAVVADEGTFIQLLGAGAATPENQAASNPAAAELVQQAFAEIRSHNYAAAREKLEQAEKLNPTEFGLWAGYGYTDMWQHRDEKGIAEYQTELKNHPENLDAYRTLAYIQNRAAHEAAAVETLRALLKAAPADLAAHRQLASMLVKQKRYAEAIPVLQEAVKQSPEDARLKVMLGSAQIAAGGGEQGAATLSAVLAGATDESILNDAAYELANASLDLPLARSSCEKALKQLDDDTSKVSLASLTDDDLKYVVHLAATWDTMAWILYRQADFATAAGYAKASWTLDPRPVIGTHLGQIYEKLGKRQDAIDSYRLAVASGIGAGDPDAYDATVRLIDLKAEMDAPQKSAAHDELGKIRSIAVPLQEKSGSADFFVVFSRERVEQVQFVKGSDPIKPGGELLRKARFDVPFPPGSSARIVRRGILFCSEAAQGCQFTMLPPEAAKRTP
jgi:tetratricopeptide (TPR) repeat protein